MSASKAAKAAGHPSLKFVYTHANVPHRTFNHWYHSNRQLFDVVVAGVKTLNIKSFKNCDTEIILTTMPAQRNDTHYRIYSNGCLMSGVGEFSPPLDNRPIKDKGQ